MLRLDVRRKAREVLFSAEVFLPDAAAVFAQALALGGRHLSERGELFREQLGRQVRGQQKARLSLADDFSGAAHIRGDGGDAERTRLHNADRQALGAAGVDKYVRRLPLVVRHQVRIFYWSHKLAVHEGELFRRIRFQRIEPVAPAEVRPVQFDAAALELCEGLRQKLHPLDGGDVAAAYDAQPGSFRLRPEAEVAGAKVGGFDF